MTSVIQIEHLDAYYGSTQVLFDVSLGAEQGAITTILGANGAGKTTMLRAICQTVTTRGQIRLGGNRIDGRSTEHIVAMGIAHVPDGRGTFGPLTVEENLRLGAYVRGSKAQLARELEAAYARFPRLQERRRQEAGTLSGGEQQMLAISRALMSRPRVLLLDEPSFGLAPRVIDEIFLMMRRIRDADGVSIVLVEQNAAMALEISEHAYVLESGRIRMSGKSEDIARDEDVRRSYLGASAVL